MFTCITTRAIHTEVVHSQDTSSCFMALRMLMAKRDIQPIEMRSDNAMCFKAADKELTMRKMRTC